MVRIQALLDSFREEVNRFKELRLHPLVNVHYLIELLTSLADQYSADFEYKNSSLRKIIIDSDQSNLLLQHHEISVFLVASWMYQPHISQATFEDLQSVLEYLDG